MSVIQRTEPRESERLRRESQAGAEKGPTDRAREESFFLGSQLGGIDPQDPTNCSFPFLRRMSKDHGVSMGVHYITMPLVKTSFFFEADDARAAAFADNIVRPIYGSTVQIICRFLNTAYSPAVKNTMVVNPSWKYLVDGQLKQVWDSSVVGALVYNPLIPLRPESTKLHYDDAGNYDGLAWDQAFMGLGGFYVGGQLKPTIDLSHSFFAAHGVEGEDGNPYGIARISYCAPIFHMYRYIWTLLGRAFENNADPGPTVRFPKDEAGRGPDDQANKDVALMIGRRKRSGSTIALPSDVYTDYMDRMTNRPKWDVNFDVPATNFAEIQSFLSYLEALKLRALWMSEQSLQEGSGSSSSRNVAKEMSNQRDASQAVLMEQIIGIIMDQLVRPAMAMNMPWYEGRLEMKTIGFGQNDENKIRQVFQLMGQQDVNKFGIDWRRLAEAEGFPMIDPAEQERQIAAAVKAADGAPAPAVTPTQGRRALVTQTGFGEMVYEQLHDPVSLSSAADGDFVASLPREDAWTVPAVVDAARAIRSRVSGFLATHYRDAAIFASKREEQALELLADDHDVLAPERAADAVLAGWAPNHDAADALSECLSAALDKAYEGARRSRLRSLAGSCQAPDTSRWRAERASWLAHQLSQSVRSDIAAEMSDALREGASVRAAAQALVARARDMADAQSSYLAQAEARRAYRRGSAEAAIGVGVTRFQALDGTGAIVSSTDDLRLDEQDLRPLPSAPADITLRRTELDDGLLARYDEDAHVVLLSPDLTAEQESKFMVALGDRFAA